MRRELRCTTTTTTWMCLILLASVFAACSGHIGDPHGSGGGGPAAGPTAPPSGSNGFAASCRADQPQTPGAADPQRLSVREYLATVTALMGQEIDGLATLLPKDPLSHGYDDQTDKLSLTATVAGAFVDAAEHVAKAVAADAALQRTLGGCDPAAASDRDACLRQLVVTFGRRAFRRPLSGAADATPADSTEVGSLLALARRVRDQAAGASDNPYGRNADVAAVVAAILASPSFLTRVYAGKAVADRPGVRALDGYELATRLSYLIWGVGPDDALLQAAASERRMAAAGERWWVGSQRL